MIVGTLTVASTQSVILTRCMWAQTAFERAKGLLGVTTLHPQNGMLISHCRSIHTFFMRFSLDVVYLAGDNTVVKVVHKLDPWRVSGCVKAAAVLETPVGTIASSGLEVGDHLLWESREW